MQIQNKQLRQYIQILRDSWWIILAMVLVTTGISTAYTYSQTPIYEATATFVVNPSLQLTQLDDVLYSLDTLAGRTSLATTYSNVLKSQIIIEDAAISLGVPLEMLEDYKITSVVLPDSSVLRLQIQGPSPALAADLANAIGATGVKYVTDLQEIYELRRLDPAVVRLEPISPNHLVDITLGVIIGLIGGVAFFVLRQFLSQTLDEKGESPVPATSAGIDGTKPQGVIHDRNKSSLQTNFSSSQPD